MKDDVYKPMAVMMPTPVSVYETSGGEVCVSRMNMGRMSAMLGGNIRKRPEGWWCEIGEGAQRSGRDLSWSRTCAVLAIEGWSP